MLVFPTQHHQKKRARIFASLWILSAKRSKSQSSWNVFVQKAPWFPFLKTPHWNIHTLRSTEPSFEWSGHHRWNGWSDPSSFQVETWNSKHEKWAQSRHKLYPNENIFLMALMRQKRNDSVNWPHLKPFLRGHRIKVLFVVNLLHCKYIQPTRFLAVSQNQILEACNPIRHQVRYYVLRSHQLLSKKSVSRHLSSLASGPASGCRACVGPPTASDRRRASTQNMAFSATVQLSGLDDHIAPSQACVKPVVIPKNSSEVDSLEVQGDGTYVEIHRDGSRKELKPGPRILEKVLLFHSIFSENYLVRLSRMQWLHYVCRKCSHFTTELRGVSQRNWRNTRQVRNSFWTFSC